MAVQGSESLSPDDLRRFESLCDVFHNPPNPQAHKEAQEVLMGLVSYQSAALLQHFMRATTSQHALVFCANALTKVVTQNWTLVSAEHKLEMRNFMLEYLMCNCKEIHSAAPQALPFLVRFLVRLVKLAWLEGPQHQDIVQQVETRFLEKGEIVTWLVGLDIYCELTVDILPTSGPSLSRHRRAALSFRDIALPKIFEKAVSTLKLLSSGELGNILDQGQQGQLAKKLLKLSVSCMSFDFMCTVPDETGDDVSTVMVPHSWEFLRDESIVQLFFTLYAQCVQTGRRDGAASCMQLLVLLASIRRSFFNKDDQKKTMLETMMTGTTQILSQKLGLSDPNCYHEVCRLIGRLNAANQLHELSRAGPFQTWLEQVFAFTKASLEEWKVCPNSKHYLLQFWGALVSPVILLGREQAPKQLQRCIIEVTKLYIESRLRMADVDPEDYELEDWEDPLKQEVLRTEQLEVLASLGKCSYHETAQVLLDAYSETERRGVSHPSFERRITWIVYMMGALVGGHSTPTGRPGSRERRSAPATPDGMRDGGAAGGEPGKPKAPPRPHVINGELTGKVFSLVRLTDAGEGSEMLELAYLYFLEEFRKVYVSEQAKVVSIGGTQASQSPQQQVQERLCTVLGLEDEDAILGLVCEKICLNLQKRFRFEQVIQRSLALLQELASGINIVHGLDRSPHLIVSGRLMLKNQTVRLMLGNHALPSFGFLNAGLKFGKYRTSYYHALSKLMFMEAKEKPKPVETFTAFMAPLEQVLVALWEEAQRSPQNLRSDRLKLPLVGLSRDLRGVATACTSTESYSLLFEWLVDKPKTPEACRVLLFSTAVQVWWDVPEVVVPLLKFMSEFVHNRSQRIAFGQNSPNGILLFREASKVLLSYGQNILMDTRPIPPEKAYRERFKGVGVCLELYSHALHGNYTNFGVFDLYGDNILRNSLQLCLNLCQSIPIGELMSYLKALKAVFYFLDLATRNHMGLIMEIPPESVGGLLRAVEEGLTAFDQSVQMQCCSIADNVATFLFENRPGQGGKASEHADGVGKFLQSQGEALPRIMRLIMVLLCGGEFQSTWSISRPLLPLLLLYPDVYIQNAEVSANQQPAERRAKIAESFKGMITGLEENLHPKTRDSFTRKVYQFAQEQKTSN